MAPKKKFGASAQPSTSKAPPLVASYAMRDAEACEALDSAGDVVGAGDTVTTSLAVDTGVLRLRPLLSLIGTAAAMALVPWLIAAL